MCVRACALMTRERWAQFRELGNPRNTQRRKTPPSPIVDGLLRPEMITVDNLRLSVPHVPTYVNSYWEFSTELLF